MKSVLVRIEGKVQGVWYRAWTQEHAVHLGLDGWVRNRPDGSVEALLSGPDEAVAAMIALCRDGPRLARVTDVFETPSEPPDLGGFHVHPTG